MGNEGVAAINEYKNTDYCVIAKPNCSLTSSEVRTVLLAISVFPILVATGFFLAGAWMIFPFAGLELLLLGGAFYVVRKKSGDYECLTIVGDRLAVEKCNNKKTSRIELHRYWARVVLRSTFGGEQRLWLCSHGKEVEFGCYMNNEMRLQLADQLKRRTGAFF